MARTRLLRALRYDERALTAQDYELWLRIAAAGLEIHKISRPLVAVRRHPDSVTSRATRLQASRKILIAKALFLRSALASRRFGAFERRVTANLALDALKHSAKVLQARR